MSFSIKLHFFTAVGDFVDNHLRQGMGLRGSLCWPAMGDFDGTAR
jgi:hypothetical protein